MKKILLAALVSLCLQSYSQCLLIELPLQKRIDNSDLIVEGRVISRNSSWNEDRNMIYTSNTIEISKVFKGEITTATLEILTPGGKVGDRMIKVDPSLSLKENETGIFMLENLERFSSLPSQSPGILRYEAYGGLQGFIKYDMLEGIASDPFDTYTDIDALHKTLTTVKTRQIKPLDFPLPKRNQKMMAIGGFAPASITAGTNSILTITGSGFGATQGTGEVRFRNADDGGATLIAPIAPQYISWTDTEIQVEVPSEAGTGTFQVVQGATTFTSSSPLAISYAHINAYYDIGAGLTDAEVDLVDINGVGGYTWQMNTAFDANTPARNSFMRAFDTWRCGTNVNWIIGTTTAINAALEDGTNIICFDNDDPLPAGVLGVCVSYYGGCTNDGIDVPFFPIELDIIFDEGSNITPLTWEFGTALPSGMEYDFETVAVHELGHGHQLGHVISPGAIMHYAISNGTSNRSLGINDLAGGNYVEDKSEILNSCGPGPMTAYTGCSALPVTITSINAYEHNKGITVEWNNDHESGVDHYELEESGNGVTFTKLGDFAPESNNGLPADYSNHDLHVYNGYNYYRVKSVGLNGEVKYTEVVKVKIRNSKPAFHIYPNPVKDRVIQIELNDLEKGNYVLEMYNSTGQLVMKRNIIHQGGSATETISLPNLAKGWYAFRLNGTNHLDKRVLVD